MHLLILSLAILLALYMAWNIGANDVANSMSTAVGTHAITLRQALVIAAVLDTVGAVFVGSHVVETMRKGIINPANIEAYKIMLGFLSSLLAASIWVTIATWREMPVSTTHSVVGAIMGFGLVAGGVHIVNWKKVLQIVLSWVISPVFAIFLAFCIFQIVRKFVLEKKNPVESALKFSPYISGITFFIFTLAIFFKTPLGKRLGDTKFTFLISGIVGFISGVIGYFVMRRIALRGDNVEEFFRRLQVLTSCYIAFSHGANDVANAVSPLAGVLMILKTGKLGLKAEVPLYILLIGGLGIAIGIITWGYKVIRTIAFKITHLSNSRAFCIDFSAASTVLLASKLGLPVSTTHACVGAVIGIGLVRGIEALNLRVIRQIIYAWLITLPVSALLSALIFKLIT